MTITCVPHQGSPCCTACSAIFWSTVQEQPLLVMVWPSMEHSYTALVQGCQTAPHPTVVLTLAFRFVLRTSTICT